MENNEATGKIVVTGANGHFGRITLEQLLQRVRTRRVIAVARDRDKAHAFAERGAEVRSADFGDASSLSAAFTDAAQVLIVSVNKLGPEARTLHTAAIRSARKAGVDRVLYTSHAGARSDSPFAPAPDHFATEGVLAEGGGAFTSLRNGFYAESAMQMLGHGLEAGAIVAPEDGPVAWTARADLAEAAAVILARDGAFEGATPPLTAPDTFTVGDIAAIASELTGREIKRITVSDAEWRDGLVARGTPEPLAEMFLGMYRASRRGDFATVDPTLATLLGRRPRTMRDILAATYAKPLV